MVSIINAQRLRLSDYLLACGIPEPLAQSWAEQLLAPTDTANTLAFAQALIQAQQQVQAWHHPPGLFHHQPPNPPPAPQEMPIQTITLWSLRRTLKAALFAVLRLLRHFKFLS